MKRNPLPSRVRSEAGSFLFLGAALALLALPAVARAQEAGPAVLPDSAAAAKIAREAAVGGTYVAVRRPWLAAGEVFATNAVVWIYDRYIREGGTNPGFRIGFNSFEENIKNGFEFDDNNFSTNMYAHPYHGNLYFNAARSNGMTYWESIPYTWAGSFMWEYFGEVHHPAANDWVATSMGGNTLGEAFFRFSQMVTDNTATGSKRTWGEVGGTLINPVRGFTRLITGDFNRVQPNPADRFPHSSHVSYRVGLRTVGRENLWTADTSRVFMELAANMGDPFQGDTKKPFDSFDFGLQLNFGDKSTFGRMQAIGLLTASPIMGSPSSKHLIAFTQHYDYFNNNAFELGGQSLAASLYSQMRAGENFAVRTQLHMNAIVMGASKSDYESISGRSYDFGPGLGFKFGGTFYYHQHPFLLLSHSQFWIHSVNGTAADHVVSGSRVRIDIPITRGFSAGADYMLYRADRNYRDFPDVYERVPELRTEVSFNL
jgi:uncharacterized protein DUF3943